MTETQHDSIAGTQALPGGCNCGTIRYLISRPVLTAFICHCHLCQKRTGSAFSLSAVIPADGLRIVAGELIRTERLLANGARNISWLCPACYSRIYTQREGAPAIDLCHREYFSGHRPANS
ncbi:MAG: GFA family protein [Deltaproteobacteria bacterium]|nr:GFA family protein [Deltaproteobacteria bacterium]